jgi:ATP-dependent Clp protease protease subunit
VHTKARSKKKPVRPSRLNSIDRIDSIRLAIDYGIDLANKTLSLTGPVDDSMYEKTISGLCILNQLQVPLITIRLNTYGGDLYAALAMYDLIKQNKTPIRILAVGQLMSAGTLIMQAAKERAATPLTQVLVHFGSEHVSGTYVNVRRYIRHVDEMEDRIKEIFCSRCNWHDEQYEALNEHDTYMSADKARSLGLIDEVVS